MLNWNGSRMNKKSNFLNKFLKLYGSMINDTSDVILKYVGLKVKDNENSGKID